MAKASPTDPTIWPREFMPVTKDTALPLVKWLGKQGLSQEKIGELFGVSQSTVSRYVTGNGGQKLEKCMIKLHGAKKPDESEPGSSADSQAEKKERKKKPKKNVSKDDTSETPPIGSYRLLSYNGGAISYDEFWSKSEWCLVARLDPGNIPDEYPVVYEFGVPGPDGKPVAKYLGKASAVNPGKSTGYMRKRFSQYASDGDSNKNNPDVVRRLRDPDSRLYVRWSRVYVYNDKDHAGACGIVTGIETELLRHYLGNPYVWNRRG